jgi:hypothetical protein
LGEDEGEGNPTLIFEAAAKGVAVPSTVILLRTFMKRQSATAPEKIRTKVNVAASTCVCFSAARQSRELLAKAIIAASVSRKSRAGFKSAVVYRNSAIVARLETSNDYNATAADFAGDNAASTGVGREATLDELARPRYSS